MGEEMAPRSAQHRVRWVKIVLRSSKTRKCCKFRSKMQCLRALGGPRVPQDGPKMAPRRPKMAPRSAPRRPKMAQNGPKMAQDRGSWSRSPKMSRRCCLRWLWIRSRPRKVQNLREFRARTSFHKPAIRKRRWQVASTLGVTRDLLKVLGHDSFVTRWVCDGPCSS